MEKLDQNEQRQFQEVLEPIFGNQVYNWTINTGVLTLLEQLLRSSANCNRQLDLVPRPFYFGNSIKWASKQARQAALRAINNFGKHHLICLRVAGLKMKNQFLMASRGL